MGRPSGVVRDVFHVVVTPSSRLVSLGVLSVLRSCDRTRWYPSMFVEGIDTDAPNQELASAARGIGVPVMYPRSSRGNNRDWLRAVLDEWFYLRNADASLVHVHAPSRLRRGAPVSWLRLLMPRVPVIESVYVTGEGESPSDRVEIEGRGISLATLSVESLTDAVIVSALYERALSAANRR
jgi:hypothetical protein